MIFETNKTFIKDSRKKIEIKKNKDQILKKKYMVNYNWRTKSKENKNFIKELRTKQRN